MPDTEKYPKPLLGRRVARLRALKAEADPPTRIHLSVGTIRFPARARVVLKKVRKATNTYRLHSVISGRQLGERSPYERISTEALKKRSIRKEISEVSFDGLRHPWSEVKFLPPKVKLRTNERSRPPVDFKLPEGVDLPCNVFPPDDRYIYQDTSFPWRTVGRVDSPLGTGTGCTIGSRLLLTCSHVVQWNNDNTAGWVRFRPSYYNGSAPFGEAWATRVISWNKANGGDGLSDFETAFDYVVCVLDTRIGDVLGYPGYRTYDDDWNGGAYWQHMGYPSDLSGAERPAFQNSCTISSAEDESTSGQTGYVLGHFNDVVPGHSGGPVWGWWDGEPWPRVVGVQSAEAKTPAMNTSGDNEFGGGPALASLISYARSNYP
jgi:V8-like Glu-specific endopeptidase